jgi:hypothetical protein
MIIVDLDLSIVADPRPLIFSLPIAPNTPFVGPNAIGVAASDAICARPFCSVPRMQKGYGVNVPIVILIKVIKINDIVIVKIVECGTKGFVERGGAESKNRNKMSVMSSLQ